MADQNPRYKTILRHLLFWLAYILYQTVHDGWENKDQLAFNLPPQFLTDIPIAIIITYVNLYVLMPAWYYNRKYAYYITGLFILLLAGGLMERYFTYLIWIPLDKFTDPVAYQIEDRSFWIPVRIIRNAVEDYPAVAIAMLLKLMRNSYQSEKQLRETEKERFNAELGLLKAQINPHFFFNTLNSLYALTLKGSKQASRVVLRLSDLMHYMLYDANATRVPLKNELKHLENYISIEQMRFADRLELSFQYSGDIDDKLITPLLLLPFVENAFKHGIENNSGWITINLKVMGSRMFLKVKNSYTKPLQPKSTGLGLSNVKRRLELIYPGRHELLIHQGYEIFEVDLKLDL